MAYKVKGTYLTQRHGGFQPGTIELSNIGFKGVSQIGGVDVGNLFSDNSLGTTYSLDPRGFKCRDAAISESSNFDINKVYLPLYINAKNSGSSNTYKAQIYGNLWELKVVFTSNITHQNLLLIKQNDGYNYTTTSGMHAIRIECPGYDEYTISGNSGSKYIYATKSTFLTSSTSAPPQYLLKLSFNPIGDEIKDIDKCYLNSFTITQYDRNGRYIGADEMGSTVDITSADKKAGSLLLNDCIQQCYLSTTATKLVIDTKMYKYQNLKITEVTSVNQLFNYTRWIKVKNNNKCAIHVYYNATKLNPNTSRDFSTWKNIQHIVLNAGQTSSSLEIADNNGSGGYQDIGVYFTNTDHLKFYTIVSEEVKANPTPKYQGIA